MNGRDASAPDYRQPAIDLRLFGTQLGGSALDVYADVRARRNYRSYADGRSENESRTRVYGASVTWRPGGGPLGLALGRQFSPSLSSVSLFDGALLEYRRDGWGAGVFAGTQPNPVTYSVSGDVREYGGFVEIHNRPGVERRWGLTGGAVTSTEHGTTNRDFLYVQGRYDDRAFSIFVTQEADLNRDWRKTAEGHSWTMSSTFATVRYRFGEVFALRAGWDNRRSVRLYRDFVSPETDFDDRHRRGYWAGFDGRVGRHFMYGLDGRRSDVEGEDKADSVTAFLGLSNVTHLGLDLRTRATRYTNDFVEGWLYSLSASTDISGWSQLELYGGVRDETVKTFVVPQGRWSWVGVDWDVNLAHHWFTTLSIERSQGQDEGVDQLYATVTYRF